jgi:hypothetical protein
MDFVTTGLCGTCGQAFQDLADALDPGQAEVYLHTVDVDAVLEDLRNGRGMYVPALELAEVLERALLTPAERDLVAAELGRRA